MLISVLTLKSATQQLLLTVLLPETEKGPPIKAGRVIIPLYTNRDYWGNTT